MTPEEIKKGETDKIEFKRAVRRLCPSKQSINPHHELPTPFECHFSRRSTLA